MERMVNMDRVFIDLGVIKIYWYSIMILLGVMVALYVSLKESKKVGLYEYFENLIFELLLFGIIGARLYYVIFNFSVYKHDLLSIFKICEDGLAIYGGIIAGLLVIIYNAKKHKQSVIKTTDVVVPGLIIAQAIGRWGNFFNQEAHGIKVTYEFLKRLHLPNFIIKGMNIDGVYYHPTFLYESIWCLLGFIFLLIIRNITNRKKGMITYSYFIWYGIGRFLIEGIRTDSLYLGSFRISQVVSIIMVIIGIIGIIKENLKKECIKKK